METFRAAQELDPAIKLRANEALVLIDLDCLEEADRLMQGVMRTKPTAYALAVFQHLRKRQGRAKEAMQALVEYPVDPTPETAFDLEMQRAETYLLNERVEEGLAILRRLGGQANSKPAAKFELSAYLTYYGHAKSDASVIEEAEQLLDVASLELRLDRYTRPSDLAEIQRVIPNERAQLLMEMGQVTKAIEILEEALTRNPADDTGALLVMMYAVAGRLAEAEDLVKQIEEKGGSSETQYLYYAAIFKLKNGADLEEIGALLGKLGTMEAGRWAVPTLRAAYESVHGEHIVAAELLEKVAVDEDVPVRQRSLALGNAIACFIRAHAFDKAMMIASKVTERLRARHVLENTVVAAGWRNAELTRSETIPQLKEHNQLAAELLELSLRSAERFHLESALPTVREYARYAKATYGSEGVVARLLEMSKRGSAYSDELNTIAADLAAEREAEWPTVKYGIPEGPMILGLSGPEGPG